MHQEMLHSRPDAASALAIARDADEGAFIDFGWWLSGGISLLAWTGFALLLTA